MEYDEALIYLNTLVNDLIPSIELKFKPYLNATTAFAAYIEIGSLLILPFKLVERLTNKRDGKEILTDIIKIQVLDKLYNLKKQVDGAIEELL